MSALVITMAGRSQRFADAGWTIPKYRIVVEGRSIFSWSIESVQDFVDNGWRLIFVGRNDDLGLASFLQRELTELGMCHADFELVQLDSPTDGQATTALHAELHLRDREPIAIYNIDTRVLPGAIRVADINGDGWLPCFQGAGDGWSFVSADDDGRVNEVREKVRIAEHCTVGFYYFSSFGIYRDAYDAQLNGSGTAELAERYVAPLYNYLISINRPVYFTPVETTAMVPLGTPAEVERFAGRPLSIS